MPTPEQNPVAAHTPAPWKLVDGEICTFEDGLIAKIYGAEDFPCLDEEDEDYANVVAQLMANARLISAAPDLLAALREIVDGGFYSSSTGYVHVDQIDFAAARAAIKKATTGGNA